ncbi:MAG TPA: hypothetical protein VK478_02470 [Gemmatimonadaceae bacterium]|nr:hypothetical protein [Gemmatimonadaceae bacterium]
MKHTHGEGVLVLALLACLTACADSVSSTVGPAVSPDVRTDPAPQSEGAERAALTKVARLVAVAMDNEPARQHLKRDLRTAPFREHKLELSAYLRSKDGRALLEKIVELNGGGERELFATLASIRPLELYMPVAKHRESWTGSAEVLVVSQLNESEPIVAFDQTGRRLVLDRNAPPAQPTLSIVPVETRFDQPMAAERSKNVRDMNGSAIGTLEPSVLKASKVVACDADCGGDDGSGSGSVGGESPPPVIPPGLYLEFSRIVDMKEPWFRGDPEIEVHIQGPSSVAAPTYGEDLSCSGEHAYDYRKVFDQNTGFWEGRVMLFSPDETVAFTNKFKQGFHVLFWEDDNEPCTLKLDTNTLVELLRSTATAAGTVALKVFPGATVPVLAAAFLGTFFANAGAWLLTNDDFLGAAVDQNGAGYYYPGNTHVIMDGTTLNGRATIVYRQ